MARIFLLAGLLLAVTAVFLATRGEDVQAAGACGTPHDSVDAEEQQFLALLQNWRNSNVPVSSQLQTSGALNAAAAWYANDLIATGPKSNHLDSTGRSWGQRALDCGFPNPYATGGSGEGYSAATGNVSAAAAIPLVTYGGSGVNAWTSSTSLPFKCVGVAVRRNAAGTETAWVVVIAQFPASSPCPASSAASTTATPTSTSTATPTPTKTPTPSPTPSPTPTPRTDGATVILYEGWNLVTLPSGPVAAVLRRANGCYGTVYQQQGERWSRYSPDVPAYANNLQTLNGGAYWVEGTAENCGLIRL